MDQKIIATIGAFDGVHRGHLALLKELCSLGEKLSMIPTVITFEPSPSLILHPQNSAPQLSTGLERVERLRSLGYENIILLSFTKQLSELTAEQFMNLLKQKYGIGALLLGYDHRFGRGAKLDFSEYAALGKSLGIELYRAQPFNESGTPISSSRIRSLLLAGALSEASGLLGYNYILSGKVVGGLQIGRSMGYPTANIIPDEAYKLIPADGVYAVRVRLEPRLGTTERVATHHHGMLYIGDRPTIDDGLERTIEVNIFDLSANLYAQRLRIEFIHYIRGNRRFSSLEALQQQIAQDEIQIRGLFSLPLPD